MLYVFECKRYGSGNIGMYYAKITLYEILDVGSEVDMPIMSTTGWLFIHL